MARSFNATYDINMNDHLDDLQTKLGFDRLLLRYQPDEQPFEPDGDNGGDFIRRVHADIIGQTRDKSFKVIAETRLGHITAYVFGLTSALNARQDIVYDADAMTGDLCFAAETLKHIFDQAWSNNIIENWYGQTNGLYVHEMHLHPEYRGKGLGRYALHRFIDRHDPASLMAVILYPNANYFEGSGDHPAKKEAADKKLRAYYRSMGFKPAPNRSKFMWLSHDSYDPGWRFRGPTKRVGKKASASTATAS